MITGSMKSYLCLLLLFVAIALLLAVPSHAETDLTNKIEIVQSSIVCDRRSGITSIEVAIRNKSSDVLIGPLTVLLDDITPSSVTPVNADG